MEAVSRQAGAYSSSAINEDVVEDTGGDGLGPVASGAFGAGGGDGCAGC